jgi:LPXTG-site transpeptidase (sortase) family protein
MTFVLSQASAWAKRKRLSALLVIAVGTAIFLYAPTSSYINEANQTTVVSNFEIAKTVHGQDELRAAQEKAKEYNEALIEKQNPIVDPFSDSEESDISERTQYSFLALGDVLGYIVIPKIEIQIPIYEGATELVLQKGIGWLPETSLPVGGLSTNSVLTGHRGLPYNRLFTDLDKMDTGDVFYIHNAMEVLAYQVFYVQIIEPSDVALLEVVKGKDYVTLLTCHPYMLNTHRLLVRGERIEVPDDSAGWTYTGPLESPSGKRLVLSVLIVAGVIGSVVIISLLHRKRKTKAHV